MASHGNVVVITSSDQLKTKINEAKEAGKTVVIDFTATWCGPCKFIAPFFAELSEKYPNLVFLEVDVDLHNDLASEYEVRAMPTFIFVKNCAVYHKIVGVNKIELEVQVRHIGESAAYA